MPTSEHPKPRCQMCSGWGTLLPRHGEPIRYCPADCKAAQVARAADAKNAAR